MKHLYIIHTILAIFFFSVIDSTAGAGFSVQFPPANSFIENEQVSMVLNIETKNVDRIRLLTEKNDPSEISIRPASSTACFQIALNKGMNTITIIGLKQGKVVGQKELSIFFRSDLFPQFRIPPAGFKHYFFHFGDNEKSCTKCHEMEPTLSNLRPEKPENSPCYTCHSQKANSAFTHKPAEQWTCFSCHEVLHGERKYTTPKPDQKVCYPCHNYEIKEWKKKIFMHGPTAVGNCTLCHNPHGSEWPAIVRMQTTDLCTNCHEEKATGTHVIAGFSNKGHPVRGVNNPLNPDVEFTCAGCHNPHAGDSQNLLNHDNSNMAVYCTLCHKR